MPGLAGPFAIWLQTAGAVMTQHMQINNSFVIFIFASFEEFVHQLYSSICSTPGKGRSVGEMFFRHSLAQWQGVWPLWKSPLHKQLAFRRKRVYITRLVA
jgi:hypothetical protein